MNIKEAGFAYEEVKRFNRYAGQLENVSKDSIALQLDLIQEEYLETVEAFDNEDPVELLDGAVDMFVVVSGLLQKLEASGYDVATAVEKVVANNNTKFVVGSILNSTFAKQNGYTTTYQKFGGITVGSYRDTNGKLKKPPGFESVVLSDCAPLEFFV